MAEVVQDIYPLLSKPYSLLMIAFVLDLCIGDPVWFPHPVRIIGWGITKLENIIRAVMKDMERLAGILLVIIIVGITYFFSSLIESILLTPNFSLVTSYILLFVMTFFTSTTIAVKGLIYSANDVLRSTSQNDIEDARVKLGQIVGRDTHALEEKSILRATIETLAENTSDGIIAPIFYFVIGGLPLAMAYKAVNTLDSMLGYKNNKYKNFGRAAARLDDIANYIPSRISGILIAVSSALVFRSLFTVHYSLKTMLRDGRKHPSPNAGIPEAAMAGALGVRLGGPSKYEGLLVKKPYIGEETTEDYLTASEKAINIVKGSSILGVTIASIVLFLRASL